MTRHSYPHIGLNAHLLASPGSGSYRRAGIHGYIFRLLEHLPAAAPDWHFTVYTGEGEPPEGHGYRVRRSTWPTGRPLVRILWEQLAQPWQLGGLDLVHELAFVAPVVMPRPFVVTVYDLSFLRYPERLPAARRLYLRAMTGLSCRRARRVIAISRSTANDLTHLLGLAPEKIDIAVPGVDARFVPLPAEDVAAWRRKHGLPERFLLFLGTLEPRKNLTTLLRAYSALAEVERAQVHLVLAGGRGWMMDEIERVIEEHRLGGCVHRPGFVEDEDLVWWYNAADAVVYPSVFEGWGLPVTEAMACGRAALVSDISSLPEAVGDTGLRVPPDDVSAWTSALRRCIQDADWRRAEGERARAYAARFTWSSAAAATIESYEKALGNISP
jgi:glycosyltransferase involved in cell wall biosynthesis